MLIANRPLVQQMYLNGSGLFRFLDSNNSSAIVGLDADIRSVASP